MPKIFVVRADFGRYITNFIRGGFVAVEWMPGIDLSRVQDREQLARLFKRTHPNYKNDLIIGRQLAQIERFLFEMQEGDFVITPDNSSQMIHYGIVALDPSYYYFEGTDGCPFPHRRKVKWNRKGIEENEFSVPFQHSIRSPMVVFQIAPEKHFINLSMDKLSFR